VREGACIGVATMPQPWTLRLTLNAAALAAAAASPTLLFKLNQLFPGVCFLLLQDLLQSCSRGGGSGGHVL